MIIKKPYAFLIKNFRYIHVAIFLLITYIIIKTNALLSFFSFYAKNHYYQYADSLSNEYINLYMFAACLGVFLLCAVIYYLLMLKDKSRLFYIILGGSFILYFVFFIIMFNFLETIQNSNVAIPTIRVLRDIMIIAMIPLIPLEIMTFGRALGFDIKKFDFQKDLEELEIEASDSEEVEIVLGKDNYKYMRTIRKIFREIKYFALEKKFFMGVISVTVALVSGLFIFLNLVVYNKMYNAEEEFFANKLWITVKDSYKTKYDLNNQLINKGKTYLVISVNFKNKTLEDIKLIRDNFRLTVGDIEAYPEYTYNSSFLDLGDSYAGQTLYSGDDKTFLLIYELKESEINGKFMLRIINDVNMLKGEIAAEYKDVQIRPKDLDKQVNAGNFFLPGEVLLGESTLNKSKIDITSYQLSPSFKEKYTYCTNDQCYEGTKIFKPDSVGRSNKIALRLEMKLELDEELQFKKYLSTNSKLLDYFGIINYRVNSQSKSYKIQMIDKSYISSSLVFLEVPEEVKNATSINVVLQIRNVKYTLVLK